MKEPGLDHRHRDKNGEISRKHGNAHVGALRKLACRNSETGRRGSTEPARWPSLSAEPIASSAGAVVGSFRV
jgi:hypothetical protein